MEIINELGKINITTDVLASISGNVATNCFGVKGMAAISLKDGLVHLLKLEFMQRGVKIHQLENGIGIDLHIAVDYGVNISAVCQSIISEVSYNVKRLASVDVLSVDVFVDAIWID